MDGHCRSGDFRRLAGGNSRGAATGVDQEALGEIHWSFWRGNSEIQNSGIITLLWLNISPPKVCLQMICLIPRWDMWSFPGGYIEWLEDEAGFWANRLFQVLSCFFQLYIQRSLNSTHFWGDSTLCSIYDHFEGFHLSSWFGLTIEWPLYLSGDFKHVLICSFFFFVPPFLHKCPEQVITKRWRLHFLIGFPRVSRDTPQKTRRYYRGSRRNKGYWEGSAQGMD